MIYRAADGTLPSIALALTDLAPPDAFCRVAAGRAAFRMIDLRALSALLDQIDKRLVDNGRKADFAASVSETTPSLGLGSI